MPDLENCGSPTQLFTHVSYAQLHQRPIYHLRYDYDVGTSLLFASASRMRRRHEMCMIASKRGLVNWEG